VCGVGADDVMGPVAGLRVQIDTVPPVTTTNARDGYMNGLTLTATDNAAGMKGAAATWYAVGSSAAYVQGTRVVFPGSGLFRVRYYSQDAAGNTETVHSLTVNIDLTPPATRATGVSPTPTANWRTSSIVTLSTSTDRSSVAGTYYSMDDGAPRPYTSPFTLSDGAHVVKYWSVDWAGNVEAAHYGYANVDSRAPRVSVGKKSVRAASAKKGHVLRLRAVIIDPQPGCGTASCTVRLKNRMGRDVGRLTVAAQPTNRPLTLTCRLRQSLSKGSYRIVCSATDAAGNKQAKASVGTLKVR